MGEFENFHPGGYFTLKKNYGRDITKYFNGAYKLVNHISNEKLYVHKADARLISNSMIFANLKG
jgi:cytochrome b involved in lipid metabolism